MIIALCCWDTPENGRYVCTEQTLRSIERRVDRSRHRIVIVDNASTCPRTQALLRANELRKLKGRDPITPPLEAPRSAC